MQTIIDCPQYTDADALNTYLESLIGQGARVYRIDISHKAPSLAVHADGAMMETVLSFIKGWLEETMSSLESAAE